MWHYQLNNQQHGPADADAIKHLLTNHTINRDTLVWKEGMGDWTRLADTDLASLVPANVPPPIKPSASPPPFPSTSTLPVAPQTNAPAVPEVSVPTGLIVIAWVLVVLTLVPGIAIFASIGALVCGILLFKSKNQKGRFQGKIILCLWVVTFFIAFIIAFSGAHGTASTGMSKDEWRSKAPNGQLIKTTGQIICAKSNLFAAVGNPDKTQTVGENVYLYWECSDGQIQVVAPALIYNAGGQIVGTVNDY